MIVNIKAKKYSTGYRWKKIKNVKEVKLTEHGCLIIRKTGDEETQHYHSQEFKEFYTEESEEE